MRQEMKNALIAMQDQSTHEGYVAYIIYFIATCIASFGKFDTDNVDIEYNKMWQLACEYLDGYDDVKRPQADCINDFLKMKGEI